MSEDNYMENNSDEESMSEDNYMERFRSRKKNFRGWGSEELIGFLTSIGRDTREPLTQLDTFEIIRDYVQENNLMHPVTWKEMVLCDERLHSPFKKRSVKLFKICDLLESHIADDWDEEFSSSSEEDDNSTVSKRQRRTTSDSRTPKSEPNDFREKVSEAFKSCYASIIDKNIKRVYLKRSLVLKLLKNPVTFENKVTGCFGRVKLDPKDFYYSPQKVSLLGQVTGIKKAPETYKIRETSSDIILHISNIIWKDVRISMLSDDDFKEAVRDGKIRSVHEDIMSHWIDREIVRLQKLIDQANEKGWRREQFEYIEIRELLRTPAERLRLLKEIPKVIADVVEEIPVKASTLNPHMENEGGHFACVEAITKETEGNGVISNETAAGVEAEYSSKPVISFCG